MQSNDVAILGYPLFHMFGISVQFALMAVGACSVVFHQLPFPTRDLFAVANMYKATYLSIPPVQLEYLAQHVQHNPAEDVATVLKRIKVSLLGGAPLRAHIGDFLHEIGLNVRIIFGSSEAGITAISSSICKEDKKWRRLQRSKSVVPYSYWEPFDESSGVYQYITAADSPFLSNSVQRRSNGDYASGDLFIASPPGSDCWYPCGRVDDTLVMKNGEKTNPVPMENEICNQDVIQACSVVGENRECTAVLVQLVSEQAVNLTPQQTIDQVHEAVHRANKAAPAHSIIMVPHMVYILPLSKKLPMTLKGNVLRKKTIDIFHKEIDQLYTDFLDATARDTTHETVSAEYSLCQMVSKVLGCQSTDIDKDRSLFHYGLDSLLAIQLQNSIASCFSNVPRNFVFEYPTITSMVQFFSTTMNDERDSGIWPLTEEEKYRDRKNYQATQMILYDYLNQIEIDFPERCMTISKPQQHTILLTGATGSLGTFLLREMVRSPKVTKVYCLVRGDMRRIIQSFEARHLDPSILSSKVEAIPMDINDWSQDLYIKLKNEITLVQLCGWRVDFNQPIQYFEQECIRGLYGLLKFAYRPMNPMHVHVVSSISATSNLTHVYECQSPQDPHVAMPMGYAQSKYIVEHLFAYLVQHKNMPCFVERTGQLSGDTEYGVWNINEQYPLIMLGGASMNMMPDLKLNVDWLPVDTAASSIFQVMLHGSSKGRFYHIVNPVKISWTKVLDILRTCGIEFSVVKPDRWVNELSKHQDNPAYRLLSFFEDNLQSFDNTPVWRTVETARVAKSLAEAPVLDAALLRKSLQFWHNK